MIDPGITKIVFDPRHVAHNPTIEDEVLFIDRLERRANSAAGYRPGADEYAAERREGERSEYVSV